MKELNISEVSLPFDGYVFARKNSSKITDSTYDVWCFKEQATHLLTIGYWNNGIKNKQVFAILDENIYSEIEAGKMVKNCLKNKEYGRVFLYKSKLGSTWGFVSHFPRFNSEENGFIECHNIIRYEKIESIDTKYYH